MSEEGKTKFNFGITRKISDGNYGSLEFSYFITRDVPEDKKLLDVTNEAIKFTEKVIAHKVKQAGEGTLPY
jgi:hypothetical protein